MQIFQKLKNRYHWLVRKIRKYWNLAFFKYASDKAYIKKKYIEKLGKRLNLRNPVTFNEKLQWLKLYNRDPLFTDMVDKYKVREYVADRVGAEYLIPSLGVWDSPDQIDFDALPEKFVLKCTHNSGYGTCICQDKSALDIEKAKHELRKGLEQNYYLTSREWPYKNVPRRIVGEEFMVDERNTDSRKALTDYKFFTFNGEPKLVYVYQSAHTEEGNKPVNTYCDVFDLDWNLVPIQQNYGNDPITPEKPVNFEKMIEISRKLSAGIPFLRVDMYEINGKVYVGEMTFYSWAGFEPFHPEEWDHVLGSWLKLPDTKRRSGKDRKAL